VLEVGIKPEWLHQLQSFAAQNLLPGPALPKGKPPADPAQLAAYYNTRANAGDTDAQFELAVLYAKGEGVKQDYAGAAKWFRAAAEHGSTRAQYDLGVQYEHGRGVAVDYTEAVSWYRKAAEHDYGLAQYNLAVAYTKGEGAPHDPAVAAMWYKRAAAQGVVPAMVNLAILYERGDGLSASTVDAYGWYRAAAHRGSRPAQQRADELLRAFAPADQTRAETKTAEIAGSIRDALGEDARLGAQGASPSPAHSAAATAQGPAPVLKSGILSENPTSDVAPRAENP